MNFDFNKFLRPALHYRLLFLCLLAGLTALPAFAQIWTDATSTDWNTPSNWSGSAVPTTSSDVTILDVPTLLAAHIQQLQTSDPHQLPPWRNPGIE